MPVLVIRSRNVLADTDEVLEYSVSRSRGDCFEFRIEPHLNRTREGALQP